MPNAMGFEVDVNDWTVAKDGTITSFTFVVLYKGVTAQVTMTPSTPRLPQERVDAFPHDLFRLGTGLLLAAQEPQYIAWSRQK